MTTFDRYLLRRYLHVFLVFFVSTFGLYVVIDGFTNVDGFQEGTTSAQEVMSRMAVYYLYHSSEFFDMVGPILSIIAVMVVFAMLYKNSELHPILAAGVPTYRLVIPLLLGTATVAALLVVNRELVIPRIAHHLLAPRNTDKPPVEDVRPIYDHMSKVWIGGKEIVRGTNRLTDAEFILPPEITEDLTPLRAPLATFHEKSFERPAGWELHDVEPKRSEIRLTDQGKQFILPLADDNDLFVKTDVSYHQLSNSGRSYSLASTSELMRRVRNPSYGQTSVKNLSLHVHGRITQPVMGFILVFIAIPLVVRKESRSLVTNIALCTGVMAGIFAVTQLGVYLGKTGFVGPSLAACAPLIVTGTLAAWLSESAQT